MKENMAKAGEVAREKLEKDLERVMAETEDLLKATAGQAGETIQGVRARVEEALSSAKHQAVGFEQETLDGAKAAAKATDLYVHENPWPAIAAAAGIGLIAGWILGRK
jgi:ElaB/YqjD/DUF883 family membrane-anchored ribosome-binding protein